MIIRRALVMVGVSSALVLASACSSNAPETHPSAPAPAVVEAQDSVPSATGLRLVCAPHLTSLELAVGTQTEPNAAYILEPVMGDFYPWFNLQIAVKLWVQPPPGITVVAAIVHTVDSNDKKLEITVGDRGVVDVRLETAYYSFTGNPNHRPINSITLCTKATASK